MNSKRNTVKILLSILILSMLISQPIQVFALTLSETEFNDVKPNAWYYKDVMEAKAAGLVDGVGNNNYAPGQVITYGNYITALLRTVIPEEEIEPIPNSTHWADKYIFTARVMGMFEKGEVVDPDKPISRQEMIRYTVNLLGLEPAESASIIFADVNPSDAAYINTAYAEYLTEGSGRNSEGLKVFGFNNTSLRSEMSAMVNRVKAYKQNPSQFKQEKAKVRAEADAAYEAKQGPNIVWNGYTIPKDAVGNKVDTGIKTVDLFAVVSFKHPAELDMIQQVIASKYGDSIAKQAIDYARTKDDELDVIEKEFNTLNGYIIYVRSSRLEPTIGITISK